MLKRTLPLALLALAAIGRAQDTITKTQSASFSVTRSVWQNGNGFPKVPAFLGLDLTGKSINIGSISSGTGLQLSANYTAKLGLQSYFAASGGEFTANYLGSVSFTYPRNVLKGQTISVKVKLVANSASSLATTSPSYSAGMEAVANFSGSLYGFADFLGTGPWNKQFAIGATANTVELFDLQDLTNLPQEQYSGVLTPLGVTLDKPNVTTSGTVDFVTQNLISSGYSPYVTFETTLADIIGLILPPADPFLSVLSGTEDWDAGVVGIDATWDICKVYAQLSFGMRHDYGFAPHATVVVDGFDGNGVKLFTTPVNLGVTGLGTFNMTMPADGGVILKPRLVLDPSFTNKMSLGVGGGAGVVPLSIDASGYIGYGDSKDTFDFSCALPTYDWTPDSSILATLDNHTFATGTQPTQILNDIAINPYDETAVPPNVYPGAVSNGLEASAPLYNGYFNFGDDPNNYELSLVPPAAMAFGDDGNASFVAQFDGMSSSEIQKYTQGKPLNATWHKNKLDISIPARLLKPGRHSVTLFLENTWGGKWHYVTYDVPVIVDTHTPLVDGELNSRSDFGGPVLHRASASGESIGYLRSSGAFLGTDVVLDDGTVLPSQKYLNGKFIPNGVYGDTDYTKSADDTNFYFSGNNVIAFTIPPTLAQKYAGTKRTIQLRTRDYKNNGFLLSPLNSTASDLYFVVPPPTIAKVAYADLSDRFPLSDQPYRLMIEGENFTPSTMVSLDGAVVPAVFVSPKRIALTIGTAYLDALHKAGKGGVNLVLSTPRFDNIPGADATHPASSGGTASKTIRFDHLAPVVLQVTPAQPIRGVTTSIALDGQGFVNALDGFPANAKTQVFINGKQIDSSSVTIPGATHRSLTQMTVALPAGLFPSAGVYDLKVRNGSVETHSNLVVQNPMPAISGLTPSAIRADGVSNAVFSIKGTGFDQKASHVFIEGKPVTTGVSIQPTEIVVTLSPTALAALPGTSAKVSVLTDGPGGGQSKEVALQIVEGDASKVAATPGPLVYDRKSDTYSQQVTLAYTGSRVLAGKVVVKLSGLPTNVTLTNGDGIVDSLPTCSVVVSLRPNAKLSFTAIFQKVGAGGISWTPVIKLP